MDKLIEEKTKRISLICDNVILNVKKLEEKQRKIVSDYIKTLEQRKIEKLREIIQK